MPTVALPDGQQVEFPDGMSVPQMEAAMREFMSRTAKPERSTGEAITRGVAMPAAGFNESLASTVGAIPDLVGSGLSAVGVPGIQPGYWTNKARQGLQLLTGAPPQPETTTEKLLYGAGKGAGDAASVMIPAAGVARAARAGSMTEAVAQALAAQPATQAVSGAAGGAVGEATGNPYLGMAASVATPSLMAGAGRVVRPVRPANTPERQALIDELDRSAVPLSAGERTGSKALGYLEGAFDVLPGSSAAQQALQAEKAAAFNRASLAHSGTDATVASPEVLNAARERIGGVIGDIANRNTLTVTPDMGRQIADIEHSLRFLPAEAAAPIRARIEQLGQMAVQGPGGLATIPGPSYRMLDSAIGRTIRETTNGDLRGALGQFRNVIREGMDASISPADQEAWQEARRQYANLMVTAKAAGGAGAGAAEGNVSPLALRGAVNQSTGGNYAFGAGDQNTLARAGQSILRKPPDSGTAGRSFFQNLLTGSIGAGGVGAAAAGADPMVAALMTGTALAAPRVAHSIYNTGPVQRYLTEGVPGLSRLSQNGPQVNQALVAALLAEQSKGQIPGTQR